MSALRRFSSRTQDDLLRVAMQTSSIRLAMKGSSMLPDLREGMTLHVVRRAPGRGDIAVFRSGGRLVAHRIVRLDGDRLFCAGDAQPLYPECLPRSELLGVAAKITDSRGRRIDTFAFTVRGKLRARFHAMRALFSLMLPQRRARVYRTLVNAMSAVLRGDDAALAEAISEQPPLAIAGMARRHRCAAALCVALHRLPENDYAASLRRLLQRERWAAAIAFPRFRRQALEVAAQLRRSGVDCVLLKGAQRAVCDLPEARFFDSIDVDVLVAPQAVPDACRALAAIGFITNVPQTRYAQHHHAPPVYRIGSLPVEIHRALAPEPLSAPITLAELRRHRRQIGVDGFTVEVLDPVATAVHLAIHAMRRPALRELVLLAAQLQRLNALERKRLRAVIDRERRWSVRITGALHFAARMAAIHWPCSPAAMRYAGWMLLREDLPLPLRARTIGVDAWLSASRTRLRNSVLEVCASAARGAMLRRLLRTAALLFAVPAVRASAFFMRR